MAIAESSRRRLSSPVQDEDQDALPNDYKPYVPVAKRRAQMMSNLGRQPKKVKTLGLVEELEKENDVERKAEEDEEEERAREKTRKERTLFQAAQEVKERRAIEGGSSIGPVRGKCGDC